VATCNALVRGLPSKACVRHLRDRSGHVARATKAVKGANMLIRALIITAAVVCADETPSG
jgi:hypothetical protein